MSWKQLVADRKVRAHTTSIRELDDLRAVVSRDLADAAITTLSNDRRYATAYNAALQIAKIAIACAGYRVLTGTGHHQATFEAVEEAIGPSVAALAAYFDTCRRKRNFLDYDMANVVSDTEVEEIIKETENFRRLTEAWITASFPHLAVAPPSP